MVLCKYLKVSSYRSQDNLSICLQTIVSKSFKKNIVKIEVK